MARKFLIQIKTELETNTDLLQTYPDVFYQEPKKEAPKWSEEKGICVKRKSNPKEATVEAHGLVDGQPTGAHFLLRVYDDVVTRESVGTPEQVEKTTSAWELSDNLGARGPDGKSRRWHIGTRYCTVAETRILMADWTHKRIADVRVGDCVVGWELRNGKRYLRPAFVKAIGSHKAQPVNTYRFDHGRSVTCTPDHRWWRGAHGSGDDYQALTVPAGRNRRKDGVVGIGDPHRNIGQRKGMSSIRELLVPIDVDLGRDAGWLAGMFDGEGTTKKNKRHPSGIPCITQTMHNPEIIKETRSVLKRLGFEWTESWLSAEGHERMISDRCVFNINGGWRERYRFLAQIRPSKTRNLAPTLFSQLSTSARKLTSVENAGYQDVFWIETETGNYVAEGFCSKNSYADTYQAIIEKKVLKLRIYPATHDGTVDGTPVFLPQEVWEEKKRTQGLQVLAAQMLQNPAAGAQALFKKEWLRFADVRPGTLNVYILIDPASSRKKGSDRTAIAVIGIDSARNKYLLDGYHHRMSLSERWTALSGLRKVWMAMPGVQMVKVGYERYGSTSDLEYFEEKMEKTKDAFEIVELAWPRDGTASKYDRIQRLEPDFRAGTFYLAAVTPAGPDGRPTVTRNQQRVIDAGQRYRIFTPTRRVDENRNTYALNKTLLDEYLVYPFAVHDDFLDACSRIYDIEAVPPLIIDESLLEPEVFADGV